jgi:hypothetical protein
VIPAGVRDFSKCPYGISFECGADSLSGKIADPFVCFREDCLAPTLAAVATTAAVELLGSPVQEVIRQQTGGVTNGS